VEWLLVGALGMMWVALLLPSERRTTSPSTSVEEFERRMELLANAETHGGPGRWIVTPRKGMRFVGTAERKKARTRERRRQVLVFLLEAVGLTFLIGLVPPLRVMWSLTALFTALLVAYVWLLLSIKARAPEDARERTAAVNAKPRPTRAAQMRHVADGMTGWARPTFNGLGSLGEGDSVHVVVRRAGGSEVGIAGT
jgi:hypothetical protein